MPDETKKDETPKAPTSVKSEPILSDAMKIATKAVDAPKTTAGSVNITPEGTIKNLITTLGVKSSDHTLSLNKAISYLAAALVQLEKHNAALASKS